MPTRSLTNSLTRSVTRGLNEAGVVGYGRLFASIGDSTMRGTYNGDSEQDIEGSVQTVAGDSWITHMCFYSQQRITRLANCGDIGATATALASSFGSYVVPKSPDTVIISGGTNDASATPQRTKAQYKADIESMVQQALAAGIRPILATPLPSNNSASYAIIPSDYIPAMNELAAQYGLYVLDIYSFAVDPGTGGLKAEYSGDGVHPSKAGQKAIGQYAAGLLSSRVSGNGPTLASSSSDAGNLVVNPLFEGTPGANGNAPNWIITGSLPAGASLSQVDVSGITGKAQRLSATATAGAASIQQTIATNLWSPGDTLEMALKFTKTGATKSRAYVSHGGEGSNYAVNIEEEVGLSTAYIRWRVPAAAASAIIFVQQDAGTGTIAVGQMTIRNLTALGLV